MNKVSLILQWKSVFPDAKMFVTAVCVIFLIKLRWPKNKSLYGTVEWVSNCKAVSEAARTQSQGMVGDIAKGHGCYPNCAEFHHVDFTPISFPVFSLNKSFCIATQWMGAGQAGVDGFLAAEHVELVLKTDTEAAAIHLQAMAEDLAQGHRASRRRVPSNLVLARMSC